MKKPKKIMSKKIAALIIIAAVFLAVSHLHLIGAFSFLENKSYDLRVRTLAGLSRPSDEIVVILLDQESLDWAQQERGWGWPWPRQAYADMLDYLSLGGANSVAIDVLFSEPSIYRNARQDEIIDDTVSNLEMAQTAATQGEFYAAIPLIMNVVNNLNSLNARHDDNVFAEAAKNSGNVIQVVMFSSQSGSGRSWPPDLEAPTFTPYGFGSFLEQFSRGGDGNALNNAVFPIQGLMRESAALGSATGFPDSDSVIRRMRLFTYFDGNAVPGLGPASLLVSGQGNEITYNNKTSNIQWGDYVIPVGKNGTSLLRYKGKLDRYIPYSAKGILQSREAYQRGEEPMLPPEDFSEKYIFFGLYAEGLYDIFNTPISSLYPGMGAHITMLDNILQGDFIRESPQWLNLLLLFAIISLTVLFNLFSNRVSLPVALTILAVLGVGFAAFGTYHWGSVWFPAVTYLAGIAAAFVSVTLYKYATEGSQKRFIKSAFSQYLSPKVVDQLILDPSQLKLGGEKREMTAIFTDIRAFSTFSEALGDPTKLVELLNFYLTKMSNIVLDNQGTIDKYEGDAIIAFFGAPIHFDNHASLACRATVQMKKAEAGINREALSQGLITPEVMQAMTRKGVIKSVDDPNPIFTRLGVNSGAMVVGNMGTPDKMDYTIMGNAVNLAARLEGVNKQYNTGGILISEYTRAQIGDEFALRPLSRVRVVGINTPIRLYELLDIRDEAAPELLEMVKNWEQGFAAYEQKDFIAAANILEGICRRNENDHAAKKYLDRCRKYIASPPDDASWDDAVDNLTEK